VVLVDGKPRGKDFHRLAGYCEQHESLLGTSSAIYVHARGSNHI
jgi:hypothetical protein